MEISRNGTKIDIMGYGNYGPLVDPQRRQFLMPLVRSRAMCISITAVHEVASFLY